MIKVLFIALIISAAAVLLYRYRKAKQREEQERLAESWINFYNGYSTGTSWGTISTPSRGSKENNIGILHRMANGSGSLGGQTEPQHINQGFSVTRQKHLN